MPQSKQPKGKLFDHLRKTFATESSTNRCRAQLEFSRYVAEIMEPFLLRFQAERPLSVFIYEELLAIVRLLMANFVKPSVLESATTLFA